MIDKATRKKLLVLQNSDMQHSKHKCLSVAGTQELKLILFVSRSFSQTSQLIC
jgi:hypothetical protein